MEQCEYDDPPPKAKNKNEKIDSKAVAADFEREPDSADMSRIVEMYMEKDEPVIDIINRIMDDYTSSKKKTTTTNAGIEEEKKEAPQSTTRRKLRQDGNN